jgi:hypothetical protein
LFKEVVPVADASLAAALKVGDFLLQHQGQITIAGDNIQVKDAKTLSELNGLLANRNSHAQGIMEAAYGTTN